MYLSFDLGGTSIKAGIVDERGNIISQQTFPTAESRAVEDVLEQFQEIKSFLFNKSNLTEKNIKGVGVGVPGYVERGKGTVHKAPNLKWENINFKKRLEKIFPWPIAISNDADAAALGELWKGAGKGYQNFLCLTLGTGIGAGIIIDGKTYNGFLDTAGEIGHFRVNMTSGRRCNCGQQGCLETESSASALVFYGLKEVNEGKKTILAEFVKKGKLTARDICQAAFQKDEVAQEIIFKAMNYLGFALANIYAVLAPSKIIIGGGLAMAGEVIFKPLRVAFDKYIFTDIQGQDIISPARLKNNAGIVGLAKLLKEGVE